jgi:hypothetical protein
MQRNPKLPRSDETVHFRTLPLLRSLGFGSALAETRTVCGPSECLAAPDPQTTHFFWFFPYAFRLRSGILWDVRSETALTLANTWTHAARIGIRCAVGFAENQEFNSRIRSGETFGGLIPAFLPPPLVVVYRSKHMTVRLLLECARLFGS